MPGGFLAAMTCQVAGLCRVLLIIATHQLPLADASGDPGLVGEGKASIKVTLIP
jgi:hypothetical protein